MPLRYRPTLAAVSFLVRQHHVRPFHASLGRLQDDDGRNHYQILNLKPTASPAEIKKSFYTLSKSHHPDHNPADPTAPRRFMRISEAYAVLSHADKRAAYDRDVLRLHSHHSQHHHAPRGSYHSTGPAGGRAASGLSRRRGTFQGPPPSFYRSGGWGTHSAKRAAAHEESTGGGGGGSSGSGGGGNYGGMGPGQDPFGHGDDVPHFDRQSHERTHRHGDERRAARRRARERSGAGAADLGSVALFIIIGSALVFTIWVPLAAFGVRKDRKGKEEKKIGQGK